MCARAPATDDNQKISVHNIILGVQGAEPPEAMEILSNLWVKSNYWGGPKYIPPPTLNIGGGGRVPTAPPVPTPLIKDISFGYWEEIIFHEKI